MRNKKGEDTKILNFKKSIYYNSQTQWFIDI